MKPEGKAGQLGTLIEMYSKDKAHTKVHTIQIGYVNELTLSRSQPYSPAKSLQQYLNQQYPIDDPDSDTQRHRLNQQVRNVFDAFRAGGCDVRFLGQGEGEEREASQDYQARERFQAKEESNRKEFLEFYGIDKQVWDCVTIHYQDVGAEITQILIFRDEKYWYRLDTDKRWPGYEY